MEDDSVPVDERMWAPPNDPNWQGWWTSMCQTQGFGNGEINDKNVHILFLSSIFCDANSSNKQFETATYTNEDAARKFFNRKAFEHEIAQYSGVEYVVVDGPEDAKKGENQLWAIRKQERTKMRGGGGDEVVVRGYYCVLGAMIVQATFLADVLQAKMTSLQSHLTTFYKTAASIPYYAINRGYYYIDPSKAPTKPSTASLDSARSSRAGTPDSSSRHSSKDSQEFNDDFNIATSFSLALRYGDDFMDENPLTGEPGSFKMTTTGRRIKEVEEREKREKREAEKNKDKEKDNGREKASPPPPIKTMGLPDLKGKGRSPTSALSPEAGKKRRKSKAPGTPGVASPL